MQRCPEGSMFLIDDDSFAATDCSIFIENRQATFLICACRIIFFHKISVVNRFVRTKGLEPPRLTAPDPKSGAATNYATSARFLLSGCKSINFLRY
jgi:hypothetical protein